MEEKNLKSGEYQRSENQSESAPENIQTIKASSTILSVIKGLYDSCGMPMYGPASESNLPELPQWAKNICEQLRLTIFKRVLELTPEDAEMDWRKHGRMMGVCQRLAAYLKSGWAEPDFRWHLSASKAGDVNKPILVPSKDLLEQVEAAFIDSMDAAISQKAGPQSEFLSGVAEGYEMFLDTRGQFVGDRGRTGIYLELLSRWQEIEALRKSTPPLSRLKLYQLFAPSVGDSKLDRLAWFKDVCDDIGLIMKERGRPPKSLGK